MAFAVALGFVITHGGPNVPPAFDQWWNGEMIELRSSFTIGVASALNVIGGGVVATLVVPLGLAVLLLAARRWRDAVVAVAALALSAGVVQLLKHLFARARPAELLVTSDFGSYPSGHAANAATLAVIVIVLFPRVWVGAIAAVWMLLMAFSRTALSVHWLSDTVGGMLLGMGVALVVTGLLRRWARATRPVTDSGT